MISSTKMGVRRAISFDASSGSGGDKNRQWSLLPHNAQQLQVRVIHTTLTLLHSHTKPFSRVSFNYSHKFVEQACKLKLREHLKQLKTALKLWGAKEAKALWGVEAAMSRLLCLHPPLPAPQPTPTNIFFKPRESSNFNCGYQSHEF